MKNTLLVSLLVFSGVLSIEAAEPEKSCCETVSLAPSAELPDTSIYHLPGEWQDQAGKEIAFASLQGEPRLLAMFFSHCEYACPIIVGDLKKIDMGIPEELRAPLRITLASFDVDRDVPAVLQVYAKRMDLAPERWTLLHGQDGDVRELAAVLGVRYRKEENGSFAHSNVIFLVNPEGEIVHRQEGLGTDPATMQQAVSKLLSSMAPTRDN